jgi:uncharacterized protein (UPF0332 family)
MTDAHDLLRDVERLSQGPARDRDDARRRTMISRAYYSAFHHVRAATGYVDSDRGGGIPTGMHKRFVDWLKGAADPQLNRYGALLLGLYSKRIQADYRLGRAIQPGAELHAVRQARAILTSE